MKRSTHPLAKKSQKWLAESLMKLMETKDYQEITVTEICKKAQVDRRTYYRNFKSKDDIIDFYADGLKNDYANFLQRLDTLTIQNVLESYFTLWEPHINLLNAMRSAGVFIIVLTKIDELFFPVYEETSGNKLEKKYSLAFVNGGLWHVLNYWLENEKRETPEEMATILTDHIKNYENHWYPYQ